MSEDAQVNNKNKKEKNKPDRRKVLYLSAASVIIIALIIGLSYAWFFNQSNMATLIPVKEPSDISILGPGGSEMTSLNLDYTAADKDSSGKVTIRRVFCVQTAAPNHNLEIVHTTNMKGLTFTLYPVVETGANSVTDGGQSYPYDSEHPIAGTYINIDQENQTSGYKYANDTNHQKNYNDYTNVQKHAEPVYWLASNSLVSDTNNKVPIGDVTYYRTYYVCEISWREDSKETDVFYILAKNS